VDIPGLTLGDGPTSILGRAFVIHADPDDHKSQPAGNSGKRVACGVIKAG
jgi:Cu-Zn family superoxide dismutase